MAYPAFRRWKMKIAPSASASKPTTADSFISTSSILLPLVFCGGSLNSVLPLAATKNGGITDGGESFLAPLRSVTSFEVENAPARRHSCVLPLGSIT